MPDVAEKIIAYKISRPDCPGFMHAGVTPVEVAECLKNEVESQDGLSPEECGQIVLEAYETTQDEIDALEDFGGW